MNIVISHPPFNNSSLEALELTLGLAALGVPITLIFIADGVYHLAADPNTKLIATKNFLKNLNCLELYDIQEVYVCKDSLQTRNLTVDNNFNCQIIEEPLKLLHNSPHNLIL